jgi:hypothetical protein
MSILVRSTVHQIASCLAPGIASGNIWLFAGTLLESLLEYIWLFAGTLG